MSRRLERMRHNPVGDWKIEDVGAVCREFGVSCEKSRSGNSHYKIAHPAIAELVR